VFKAGGKWAIKLGANYADFISLSNDEADGQSGGCGRNGRTASDKSEKETMIKKRHRGRNMLESSGEGNMRRPLWKQGAAFPVEFRGERARNFKNAGYSTVTGFFQPRVVKQSGKKVKSTGGTPTKTTRCLRGDQSNSYSGSGANQKI